MIRLGVNIDHVATIRNARGGLHPDPTRAAILAELSGADGITTHLREDRRHIIDEDIAKIKQAIAIPLNFEMAVSNEMLLIACRTKPNAACLVPEKREERTTEGGLNLILHEARIKDAIEMLRESGIKISLFIEPDQRQIEVAAKLGADIVEIHTGSYCHNQTDVGFKTIARAVASVNNYGIECHAGHGLDYKTASLVASIGGIAELNIGHFLIGEAIFIGLTEAIKKMKVAISGL